MVTVRAVRLLAALRMSSVTGLVPRTRSQTLRVTTEHLARRRFLTRLGELPLRLGEGRPRAAPPLRTARVATRSKATVARPCPVPAGHLNGSEWP